MTLANLGTRNNIESVQVNHGSSRHTTYYPPHVIYVYQEACRDPHFGFSSYRMLIIMPFQSFHPSTSFLLVCSKLLQLIKRHLLKRLLIRSVQKDLGNDRLAQWVVLVGIECFSPSIMLHGQHVPDTCPRHYHRRNVR